MGISQNDPHHIYTKFAEEVKQMEDAVSYCGWYCKRCPGDGCVGCKQGGDDPNCRIRICAREEKVEACALCHQYPCEKLADMIARFPMLLENGKRIKEIGIGLWRKEQDELAHQKYVFE